MIYHDQLQPVDILSQKEPELTKTVLHLEYSIRWPEGHINRYLQSIIHKQLRIQPGILSVIFSGMNENTLRVDYDPLITNNLEIHQILKYFNLDTIINETC